MIKKNERVRNMKQKIFDYIQNLQSSINEYDTKQYGFIVLGCLVSAIGINLFLTPNSLLADGATGIAMIFYFVLGIPLSLGLLLINIPLFYYFRKYLSPQFMRLSLLGFIVYTIVLEFTSSFLVPLSPTNDLLLSAVFGGVLNGIGCGLVFKASASQGGTDIVGVFIKKKYGFGIGTTCFVINAIIVTVAMFTLGTESALYTLISMYVTGQLTDKTIEGIDTKKTVFIISKKYQLLSKRIINEVDRSTTIIQAQGGYSGDDTRIIMSVVTATQVVRIKRIIRESDRSAFVLVWDASEVKGSSFSKILPIARNKEKCFIRATKSENVEKKS